jgi:hypothetical protein
MRILLDENTPRGLRRILTGHDIRTAPRKMGSAAYSNGQLLDEAEKAAFDALVTCDQKPCFSTESHRPKYSRRDPFDQYLADHSAQPQRVQRAVANAFPGIFSIACFGRQRRFWPAPD